jgi:hypothetical protein
MILSEETPMIKSFHIQNYKALRDVTLELTPIHVLIGPNDSGKTSILEALTAYCRMTRFQDTDIFQGRWKGRELVWRGNRNAQVCFGLDFKDETLHVRHNVSCQFSDSGKGTSIPEEKATVFGKPDQEFNDNTAQAHSRLLHSSDFPVLQPLRDALRKLQSYRWIPSHLALPISFDFSTQFGMDPSGFGLAMYLNDTLNYDHRVFGELERRFHTHSRRLAEFACIERRLFKPGKLIILVLRGLGSISSKRRVRTPYLPRRLQTG